MFVVAVDFDGTLCKNKYPDIGEPRQEVLAMVKGLRWGGAKLILWTCREGELLEKAVEWCKEQGLEFDAVNENLPERIKLFGTNPRKIGADLYIDDKAVQV